jgi:hypothetical protein
MMRIGETTDDGEQTLAVPRHSCLRAGSATKRSDVSLWTFVQIGRTPKNAAGDVLQDTLGTKVAFFPTEGIVYVTLPANALRRADVGASSAPGQCDALHSGPILDHFTGQHKYLAA